MQTALVTGAREGLGLGFVSALSDSGWRVFGGVRAIDGVMPTLHRVEWIELDVTDDVSIIRAAALVRERAGTLDLLVNNAGVNKDTATGGHKELVTKLPELSREPMLRMFDVNALGPLFVAKQFVPLMPGDPSFIINVSSCRASHHDKEGNAHANYGYRASKAALNMLVRCSLFDLPRNVRTFAVHPGSVHTHMNPDGEHEPLDQARQILSIIDAWSDDKNGGFLDTDGSFYPL